MTELETKIEEVLEAIKKESARLLPLKISLDLADARMLLEPLTELLQGEGALKLLADRIMAERHRTGLHACEVCSNVPDVLGSLEHGKGCYKLSEDGGGSEYIEEADLLKL